MGGNDSGSFFSHSYPDLVPGLAAGRSSDWNKAGAKAGELMRLMKPTSLRNSTSVKVLKENCLFLPKLKLIQTQLLQMKKRKLQLKK